MGLASDALHGAEVDLDQLLDLLALMEPDRNAGIARQAALELAEDVRQLRLELERIGELGSLGHGDLEERLRAVTNELDFRNLVLGHVTLRWLEDVCATNGHSTETIATVAPTLCQVTTHAASRISQCCKPRPLPH